jgi:hypothetical protein
MKCVAMLWCWWTERNKANIGARRLPLAKLQTSRGCGHSPVVVVAVAHLNDQSLNPVMNEFREFSRRDPAATISFNVYFLLALIQFFLSFYYSEWNHSNGRHLTRANNGGPSFEKSSMGYTMENENFKQYKDICMESFTRHLPVLATLAGRHILISSQCPMCNICPEDIHHMTFKCQRAKLLWQSLGLLSIINQLSRFS